MFWLAVRLSKLINEALSKEQEQNEAIEELQNQLAIEKKQRRKLEQLISDFPAVTKNLATWLQDRTRNGGLPPERIKCAYVDALERGIENDD
jgi:folate-binding Fe-S cluster repair protein YgfZ